MMNMESNLKDGDDKTKLRAADFLEKNVGEITDKIASGAIRKTILNFRNEEEYTSVNFEKGDFNSVLNKAKEQDKLIFFDAYADWCGPCKVMDATVFADPVAGRYFNTNFINAKVDMEKGEGPELLKTYPVSAFPTYLLIDKNGKEVHRIVGSYETTEFINLIRKGSEAQNGLTFLKEAYKNGRREPAMMKNLAEGLSYSYQKGQLNNILNDYFDGQTEKERVNTKNLFMYQYSSGIMDKKFQYFIENADQIKQQIGEKEFFATIDQVAVPNLMNEQVNFKKKDFIRTKFPQLYNLNLPTESQTKLLMGVVEIAGEGNLDKLIEYQTENVLKLTNERDRLMTLYLLLSIPNKGTSAQKIKLQSLLKNVLANTKKEMIKDSLEMFLKNLEGNMDEN